MSRLRVFWNSVSAILLFGTNIVIGFFMAPVLVSHLGAEQFGLWEVMLGLVGYLGLLDLGISPAVIRFLAVARGADDPVRLQKIFSASLAFFFTLGAIGAVVLWIAAIQPSLIFASSAEHNDDLRAVVLVFSLNFIFSYAQMSVLCYLLGAQHYRTVNTLRVFSQIAQALVVYSIFTRTGHGTLMTLVTTSLTSVIIEGIIFTLILRRREPELKFFPKPERQAVRELFSFGIKSATITASATIMKSGIPLVLAHAAGVAQIVFFVFPVRIAEYAQGLSNAIGVPLTPYLAHAFGQGGTDATRTAWVNSTRALHFVAFGVAMGILWLGLPFIGRWMGPEYVEKGAGVFALVCIAMFAQTLAMNCSRVIVSMNMHGTVAKYMLVLGVVCLTIAYPLTLRFGIEGAAAAAALFTVVQSGIELTLACKYLGQPVFSYVRSTIARYFSPVLVGSAVLYLLHRHGVPETYPQILLHALAGGVAYAVTSVATALSKDERRRVRHMLRTRLGFT